MHDELKTRNYAPWAIVIGAILVIVTIMGWSRGLTGGSGTSQPPNNSPSSEQNIAGKKELAVSRQAIKVMVEAALSENPALRENMPALEKEYEQGAITQEMLVAEAVANGLAASDPIVRNRLSELFVMGIYQQADVGITPEAVRKYYEEHKQNYTLPERIRVQHLFVRVTNVTDSEKARATLIKLFKQAMGPESKQSESLKQAIAPAWITREELRMKFGPTFADEMFSAPEGDWKEVQSTSGRHMVKILEHQMEHQRNFEEAQAEAENDLRTKLRLEAYRKELERLSKKYNVTIRP